jgi:hypothetical protein
MNWNLRENQEKFHQAYGAAMGQWAGVENALSYLFVRLTGTPEGMGRDLFFSARSFLGRVDMLAACISHVQDLPEAKDFLRELVKKAGNWQSARNTLAHDIHEITVDYEADGANYIISDRANKIINAEKISNAAENFLVLGLLIINCRGHIRTVREPQLCLQVIEKLPKSAFDDGGGYISFSNILRQIQYSSE